MRYISQKFLERAVLVKLFTYSQDNSNLLSGIEIAGMFGDSISEKRIELAGEALDEASLIYTSYAASGRKYEIKKKGYFEVEKLLQEPYSFETVYRVHGDKWFLDVDLSEFEDEIPASDRVVALDHNAPEYVDAVKTLDDVIREFREDHSFGNDPPLDRDVVLGELETGKKMMAESAVRPQTIKEILWSPLKWLSEEFAKKSLGELAKIAIKALFTWLGIIS